MDKSIDTWRTDWDLAMNKWSIDTQDNQSSNDCTEWGNSDMKKWMSINYSIHSKFSIQKGDQREEKSKLQGGVGHSNGICCRIWLWRNSCIKMLSELGYNVSDMGVSACMSLWEYALKIYTFLCMSLRGSSQVNNNSNTTSFMPPHLSMIEKPTRDSACQLLTVRVHSV